MNDKFYDLTEEKQLRIINAGLEVFSKNEYNKASTEKIAQYAGISKGLLFYYFRNKKDLYFYLYQYAKQLVEKNIVDAEYKQITDFFDLCEYAAQRKLELLKRNPYISEFAIRAYYSQQEDISNEISKNMQHATSDIFENYFKNIDFSKFKENIIPTDIVQMLTWMTDGYLHERQRQQIPGESIDIDDLTERFHIWAGMLKQISYKKEYLS